MLFAVSNFRNRWGMRPIFFSKCWKFLVDFTILETNSENIFNFGDNWIWIGCVKHSVLAREREYLLLGVAMLTNSLKILDTTENQSCEHNFLQKDKKVWENYCRADVSSVSDHSTCWLSISVETWGFLGISVTTLFAVYNFRRKSAMRLIFSFKNFKIWCRFEKFREELRKYFRFRQ